MGKTVFYFIASTIVYGIAYALGFGWEVSLLASLIVPPLLLIFLTIAKYKHWV